MPRSPSPGGIAAWSSEAWRESAVSWLDEQLSGAGIERTGEVEQPRLRPWATLLTAPTTHGPVWLKAASPHTAFEVPLYELLTRTVPDRVLAPIGADPERGWVLLPDGGPSLGERRSGEARVEGLVAALVQYGRLQRELEPHVAQLLSMGLADMRPAAMPARFDEALEAVELTSEVPSEVSGMKQTVASWCERLASSPGPSSLDHNDLHPWNILGDPDHPKYYDWGDSVVAHPFAAARLPLLFVQRDLETGFDDPRFLRARDAYLEVFTDLAPRAELVETLEVACHVAKIARVLTWDRALRAARDQGEPVEDDWVSAPRETLVSLLDESYLAGG